MYRALEHMNVRGPEGKPLDIEAGQEVPGFAEWSPWVQQALTNERRVRWAPEGLTEPELARAKKLRRVESNDWATEQPDRPAPGASESVPFGYVAGSMVPAAQGEQAPKPATRVAPPKDGALQCDICQRTGFKNIHGLTIHKKNAHK